MFIQINSRRYDDYGVIDVVINNNSFDLGMLNNRELKELLSDLNSAVEDIQWLVNVTEK